MAHIRERMQDLRTKLEDKKAGYRNELQILGEKVEEKSVMINQVLKKFSAAYCEAIVRSAPGIDALALGGGARINDIFHADFTKALGRLQPLGDLVLEDITNAIEKCGVSRSFFADWLCNVVYVENSRNLKQPVFVDSVEQGLYPTLLVPEEAFRHLIERRIGSFKDPVVDCGKSVHDEMERIIEQSPEPVMVCANYQLVYSATMSKYDYKSTSWPWYVLRHLIERLS